MMDCLLFIKLKLSVLSLCGVSGRNVYFFKLIYNIKISQDRDKLIRRYFPSEILEARPALQPIMERKGDYQQGQAFEVRDKGPWNKENTVHSFCNPHMKECRKHCSWKTRAFWLSLNFRNTLRKFRV